MAMVIKALAALYSIGAFISFLTMWAFLRFVAGEDGKNNSYYDDSEFPDYEREQTMQGILEVLVSILLGALWIFVPVYAAAFCVFSWIKQRFPELLGRMYDKKEDDDSG